MTIQPIEKIKKTKQSFFCVCVFLLSLFCSWTAQAEGQGSLYQARLSLAVPESEPSLPELKAALLQVLSAVNGQSISPDDPAFAASFKDPKQWLLSYQYIPATADQALSLELNFDPEAIQKILKKQPKIQTAAVDTSALPRETAPMPVQESQPSSVQMAIYGISDLSILDSLKASLAQLTPVKQVEVSELSPNQVLLTLSCQGGTQALQTAIAEQLANLTPITPNPDPSEPERLAYQWSA